MNTDKIKIIFVTILTPKSWEQFFKHPNSFLINCSKFFVWNVDDFLSYNKLTQMKNLWSYFFHFKVVVSSLSKKNNIIVLFCCCCFFVAVVFVCCCCFFFNIFLLHLLFFCCCCWFFFFGFFFSVLFSLSPPTKYTST